MIKMRARPVGHNYLILADDFEIGFLVAGPDGYGFRSTLLDSDDVYTVNARIDGSAYALSGLLAQVRAGYEETVRRGRELADHERWCEDGWLRAAEYDPQARAEMEMEDRMGLT
jgi:hypothetical protein